MFADYDNDGRQDLYVTKWGGGNQLFHNTGVSWGKEPLDLGRYDHTRNDADRGRFKTPTLRGLTRTARWTRRMNRVTARGE